MLYDVCTLLFIFIHNFVSPPLPFIHVYCIIALTCSIGWLCHYCFHWSPSPLPRRCSHRLNQLWNPQRNQQCSRLRNLVLSRLCSHPPSLLRATKTTYMHRAVGGSHLKSAGQIQIGNSLQLSPRTVTILFYLIMCTVWTANECWPQFMEDTGILLIPTTLYQLLKKHMSMAPTRWRVIVWNHTYTMNLLFALIQLLAFTFTNKVTFGCRKIT